MVTGSGSGIGRAAAEQFAAEGGKVVVIDRNDTSGRETVAAIVKQGGTAIFSKCDVISEEQIVATVKLAVDTWGQIDVLVNNTGLFLPGKIHEEPDTVLRHMIETNLYSAYFVTKSFVGDMIKRRSGHIFNMCSTASITPSRRCSSPAATTGPSGTRASATS